MNLSEVLFFVGFTHHQMSVTKRNHYIFGRGYLYINLCFDTVTGWGVDPRYIFLGLCFENHTLPTTLAPRCIYEDWKIHLKQGEPRKRKRKT